MSLNLHCGSCGKAVAVKESEACTKLKDCPKCGKEVIKDNQALMRDTDSDIVFVIRVEKKKPVETKVTKSKKKPSGK